jgi:hypothetical protein
MSLLRSPDTLLHLSLMAAHLGEGQIVDGLSLAADMNADLPALLRSFTPSREPENAEAPTLDAEQFLTKWTKRGWVHRSVDLASRIERHHAVPRIGLCCLESA